MKLIIFVGIATLSVGCLAVEKRRDDVWPPPEILETFRPIAAVCKEKTGVTQGELNTEVNSFQKKKF